MEEKLKEFYRLKYLDFTCYDVIAPHGVLDIFQDIAGKHSESYGMSYDEMMASNKIWVLLRVKYRVLKNIPLYGNVNAITWPKKKGLVDFDRETIITDLEGNTLIEGISKWIVLDATTRKIIPARHIEYCAPCPEDSIFNDKFDKIKDFSIEGLTKQSYIVQFCDVDHNGHTNNAKYASMALNAICLSKEEVIKEFEINFVNESYLKDEIDLYYIKEENCYFVKGVSKEKTIFLSKLTLE